jgi:hypothetical protein
MSIDYGLIEGEMAVALSSGLESNLDSQYASLPITGVPLLAEFVWTGIETVSTTDTSQVEVDKYIRLDADGNWYKIVAITVDANITVEDTYNLGTFPTGVTQSSLAIVDPPPPLSANPGSMDTFSEAIASAVTDGIKSALDNAEISGTTAGLDTIGPGVIS